MADPLAPGADLAKVYGEQTRCPACGAFARVVPSDEHRWVCGVCGAPRVVMPAGEPVPEESALALREASRAQRSAAMQRLVSFVTGAPAAGALVLAVVLATASVVAAGVLVGTGLVLAVLASRASRRAATERKRVRAAVARANEVAIATLAGKNMSPAEVAAALRIPESEVEAALTVTDIRVALPTRVATPAARDEEAEEEAAQAEAEARLEKKP